MDEILARLGELESEVADVRRQWGLNSALQKKIDSEVLARARLIALGEMSQDLAHELRQPLSVVSMAAQNMLLRIPDADPAYLHAKIDRIMAAVQRASKIIDQLRRFAMRHNDGSDLQAVPLDTAVADAVFMLEPALRQESILLKIEIPPGPASQVLAFPVALEQVLTNLILNARDAINEANRNGLRQIGIYLAPMPQAGAVALRITDTGTGIPAHVLKRLFEPFVTTKGPEHGTGLGLPLCHRLVAAMGGTIEGGNTESGAVFTVTLNAVPTGQVPQSSAA